MEFGEVIGLFDGRDDKTSGSRPSVSAPVFESSQIDNSSSPGPDLGPLSLSHLTSIFNLSVLAHSDTLY